MDKYDTDYPQYTHIKLNVLMKNDKILYMISHCI